MKQNTYMMNLAIKLTDKGLNDKTVRKYINDLVRLNDDEQFKNLSFLKNFDTIKKIIDEKNNDNTKKNYIGSILGVLSLYYKSPIYKKYIVKYNDYLTEIKNNDINNDKIKNNEKTNKQNKNWIEWEEILEKRNQLKEKVNEFINNKKLKKNQYNTLLSYLVLSLYTYQSPRRNEYANMFITNKNKMDDTMNYINLKTNKFIFNNYKTSKKFGKQEIDINVELMNIIQLYLKHHPTYKKNKLSPFLVLENGKNVNKTNGITRILNKIFNPLKIGASMIRHIYLSHKFGDVIENQKETSENMAHSISTQKEYIKTD